ncbi:MAG: hypothetical protein ACRDOK_02670 [Streptosporangiaceae bacterium]
MPGQVPHYKSGPSNYQVATLIFAGQFVQTNTATAGTTDYTVKVALSGSVTTLGVAGNDANVVAAQTGAADAYGQPAIDISVLTDYCSVYYGGVDTWVWYVGPATVGQKLIIGATQGAVTAESSSTADLLVGVCTHPGGVAGGMLTQAIGGLGSAVYFLGRARVF